MVGDDADGYAVTEQRKSSELENGWTDVGPPGSEDLADASSGGGRRPGRGKCSYFHQTHLLCEKSEARRLARSCEAHYSPLKSAFRFSPNALMPSFASC